MIITQVTNDVNIRYAYLNIFPDQFKTDKEKENESWIKNTMDYFANVGYAQYKKNLDTFVKNYDLLNGTIDATYFYKEPQVKDLISALLPDEELPAYVKHYSILNPPINTMLGEQSKRPDIHRVKAYDDDSRSEELQFKTDILQQYIIQEAQNQIQQKLALQGQDVSQLEPDQLQQMTMESVKDQLMSYTSIAEKWGNHTLTALKAFFNTKEMSEEAMRDLLLTSQEYYHIIEDNSKLGFTARCENPKNVWKLGVPDMKYTSGVSGHGNVPYAIGTVHVKEISEIIEEVPELTPDEIKHLRTSLQDFGLVNVRPSNLFNGSQGGIDSITYDTYSRLVLQERMMVEASLKENNDELRDWLGLTNSTASFGYKYVVIRAYWCSKKKVGKLTYIDEDGEEQTTLVDESYKKVPNQISLEWGWVNQWYQGIRVGPDIYHVKPFKLLPYAPIIGTLHNVKNTSKLVSMFDLMKPYQVIVDIAANQIFELLEKEYGNVAIFNIRRIPRPKDGDANDAFDSLDGDMRQRGVAFDDDSPENTKGPTQNQTVARNLDLTRTSEIQSRYNLIQQMKDLCYELVGMNRQRMGGALATETATANNNALVQSFAQTEPYFTAHNNVLNQFYQALLDAAQYVESQNELSTINYITAQGESAFIQVQGSDIRSKALWVMVTSKQEDNQLFNELRQLSQAALQNGASFYEISQMYTTNSIREIQRVLKDSEAKQQERIQQEQQMKQQELEQQQQQSQQELQQQEEHFQQEQELKKYEIDTRANTELGKAQIQNYFKVPDTDSNNNNIPDAMEVASHTLKLQESLAKRDLEQQNINLQYQKLKQDREEKAKDRKLAEQKLQVDKQKAKQKPKSK